MLYFFSLIKMPKGSFIMSGSSKSYSAAIAVYCSLLMIVLGASDALRGVFLPQFQSHFSLSKFQASMIIMVSYVGNLLFLFIGGYIIDRVSKKKFIAAVMLMWMAALAVYIRVDNYALLLLCMIFSMGASTMLSTTVNIITPLAFAAPAFFINVFNFMQGIGISGAQNVGGRFAEKYSSWHYVNGVLLLVGVACFVMLMFIKIPEKEKSEKSDSKGSYLSVLKNPACKYLILLCGFYYIAEHGLQNWLVTYGSEHLGFTVSRSAMYLSLFFGGITVGRLVFAPLVQKFGVMKSMSWFISIATLLYVVGLATGKSGMVLVCVSGLAFSIIWPTLVLMISTYYAPSHAGIATGFITGISTVFDIAFNAFFGKMVEGLGFSVSINVLPAAMILFCLSFFLLKYRVKRPEC